MRINYSILMDTNFALALWGSEYIGPNRSIGTTSPSTTLDVNGAVAETTSTALSGASPAHTVAMGFDCGVWVIPPTGCSTSAKIPTPHSPPPEPSLTKSTSILSGFRAVTGGY